MRRLGRANDALNGSSLKGFLFNVFPPSVDLFLCIAPVLLLFFVNFSSVITAL